MGRQGARSPVSDESPGRGGGAGPGLLLAGLFLGIGAVWATVIPPMMAPDEPAHLQAVVQARTERALPTVRFERDDRGDWQLVTPADPATVAFARSSGIDDPFRLLPYESMQPPLYYVVAAVMSLVVPPEPGPVLVAARLVSIAFGALAVGLIWAAARQIAPDRPGLAIASAGFVALLPQFAFNSASVSNDSTLNALAAAAFLVWFRGLRDPRFDPRMFWGGAVVGLAILAKLTAMALVPGLAALVLIRSAEGPTVGPARWRRALGLGLTASAGLLLVCGPWLVRNLVVFGEPTGSRAAMEFYQQRFTPLDLADPSQRAAFLGLTWESFWGRFGWLHLPMPSWCYASAALASALGLATGAVALARRLAAGRRHRKGQQEAEVIGRHAAIVMATVAVTLIILYVQFNRTVALQAQARYLFPALLPIALLLTAGPCELLRGRGRPATVAAVALAVIWLTTLQVVGLFRVVSG